MSIDPTAQRLSSAGVAYAPEITAAARRHHIDPCLLAAVAAQETGGPGSNAGRNVVGDGGHGRGLFQIDDRWHPFANTQACMDPSANADYAAGMLQGLIGRYGDVRSALSAYNAGDPHAVGTTTQWGDGETLDYADSVLRHYESIAGSVPPAQMPVPLATPALPMASSVPAFPAPSQSGMPSLQPPGMTQPQSYHRQETDYAGLFDSDDSTTI